MQVNWFRGPDEPPDNPCWDSHTNESARLRTALVPPMDQAFSALLDDLEQRGLLGETLVVCLGEFGRTPQINANAGRDHWAACNTVVFAGGGVRGGRVIGASDRSAAFPVTPPVSTSDLAATIYQALGIDPRTELRDALGRPLPLTTGRPLDELFA